MAMWISKLRVVVAATFMFGTLGTGVVLAKEKGGDGDVKPAVKEKGAPGDVKPVKEGKGIQEPAGNSVSTSVTAIDASAGTITAAIPQPGQKVPPATLKLAANVP